MSLPVAHRCPPAPASMAAGCGFVVTKCVPRSVIDDSTAPCSLPNVSMLRMFGRFCAIRAYCAMLAPDSTDHCASGLAMFGNLPARSLPARRPRALVQIELHPHLSFRVWAVSHEADVARQPADVANHGVIHRAGAELGLIVEVRLPVAEVGSRRDRLPRFRRALLF